MTPDRGVDVVIVTFNTRAIVLGCLEALHTHPPAALASVTVVDNASQDGTAEAVRAGWPAVTVHALDRNVGFAAANNLGIRATRAPYVLLLNSDTVVPPGAIDRLIARLEAHGAVAAGPRLVNGAGRPEVSFGSALTPLSEAVQRVRVRLAAHDSGWARAWTERRVAQERLVDWVSGACLLVRRDAALGAGLLDDRYFMYEEDVDFCVALRQRGGRVLFTPLATITHLGGQSARLAPGPTRAHYDRSHLAYYAKHAPRWLPWLTWWLRMRGRLPGPPA